MKKNILLLLCLFFAAVIGAKAQDIGQVISGSTADANKYLTSYLESFGKGEILNMGRGWSNTARVHKTLGIDITISAQLAIIPDAKRSFIFNKADYSTFTLKNGASSASLPNFLGDKSFQTISVNTTVNGKNVSYEFNTPTGIGDDMKKAVQIVAVPLPVAQVGIGLFKHTELKLRYFPKKDMGGTQIGVFGLAVQHELSNYIPFFKKAPLLHLSVLAGYNSVNVSYDLSKNGNMAGSNQRAELNISALTLQGIASVKLAMFEVYTTLGYTTGKADASLKGNYTVTYTDKSTTPNTTFNNTVTDPVALNYTNSGISNTWGLRVNLFFLKIFADYTFANYNGAGAGIAFSFR